jgi:hypothetical protein
MKWVKGVSGNPGGRPKLEVSLRELAQKHTVEAVETLVHVMRTGKPAERALAANSLLDRGFGKPAVAVEMSGSNATLVDLLVSLNNAHADSAPEIGADRGDPALDAAGTANSDADLLPVPGRYQEDQL